MPPAARLGRTAGGLFVLLVLLPVLTLACAQPIAQDSGSRHYLAVANAHDGTVSLLPSTGSPRPPGAVSTAPAAPQAWQIAAGKSGARVLTIGGGSTHGGELTLSGRNDAAWWSRLVPLEPHAAATLLVGDGDRLALVAYGEGSPLNRSPVSACALVLLDLDSGAMLGRTTACTPGETVTALQLGSSPESPATPSPTTRPRALAGVWSTHRGGRVLSIDPLSGDTLATAPVPGVPTALLPAEDRLHVWLGDPPAEPGQPLVETDPALPGALLTLDAATLNPLALVRLAEPVTSPALALPSALHADTTVAYALAGARRSLVAVDLSTGTTRRLAQLPAAGSSIVFSDGKLFVPVRERDSLAVYDLTRSVSLPPVPTGRGPLALTRA